LLKRERTEIEMEMGIETKCEWKGALEIEMAGNGNRNKIK
jgi:hypothetical protein